jgi:hypothetical protein
LLQRTGFDIDNFNNLEFDLNSPDPENPEQSKKMKETYYCIVATKARPLDIK